MTRSEAMPRHGWNTRGEGSASDEPQSCEENRRADEEDRADG
jgi:hypothetical protein